MDLGSNLALYIVVRKQVQFSVKGDLPQLVTEKISKAIDLEDVVETDTFPWL